MSVTIYTAESPPEVVTPPVETARDYLLLGGFILAVVIVCGLLLLLFAYIIPRMTPEQAKSSADGLERALEAWRKISTDSKTPWDNFGFYLSEPAAREIIKMLRAREEYQAAETLAKAAGLDDISLSRPHR